MSDSLWPNEDDVWADLSWLDEIRQTWMDTRWQCSCGRFISDDAIRTRDVVDPMAYYGVSTEWEYDCSRCGHQAGMPRCVEVREVPV